MKGQATLSKQGVMLCNSLAITADFDSVPPEILVELNNDPKGAAQKFVAWLKNRGNLLHPGPRIIQIDRSNTKFDPAEFVGKGWTLWKGPLDGDGLEGDEDQDSRVLVLTEIDLNAVQFDDCLEEGDGGVIKGEVKLARLKVKTVIRLDPLIAQKLYKNPHMIPEHWKTDADGNTRYISFDGQILRYPSGFRCVLYLYFKDGAWYWSYYWLDDGFHSSFPSVVLASN